MSVITIKKTYDGLRMGKQIKTLHFQITGNAPHVEKLVLIKQKPK